MQQIHNLLEAATVTNYKPVELILMVLFCCLPLQQLQIIIILFFFVRILKHNHLFHAVGENNS